MTPDTYSAGTGRGVNNVVKLTQSRRLLRGFERAKVINIGATTGTTDL